MNINEGPPESDARRPTAGGGVVSRPRAVHPSPGALSGALWGTFEFAFLGYLAATAAFTREFAHVHLNVHGVPLFAGELALIALTILAAANVLAGRRPALAPDVVGWALLIFLAIGAVFMVRGLLAGLGLAVLRDFALVYYAWFFFLTVAYLRQGGTATRLLGALLLGGVVGSFVEIGGFFASPSLTWGHATASFNGLIGWAAVVIVLALATGLAGFAHKAAAGAAVVVCTLALYLTAYRTLLVVAAVSVAAGTLWSRLRSGLPARRYARLLWAWVALIAVLIAVPRIALPSPPRIVPVNGPLSLKDALGSISHRWTGQRYGSLPKVLLWGVPTRADPQDWKGSVSFRRAAWERALVRIEASPLFGIGYGTPVILYSESACDILPSPTSNCGSAHNTYLTLAVRMGVPSALFFCGVMALLLARSGRASTRPGAEPAATLTTAAATLALLSFLVFGLTGLLFESPYLSSVVWVLAGIVAHQTAVLQASGGSDRDPRPAAR